MGEFERDMRYLQPPTGGLGGGCYQPEPGRFRLIAARACPWANRSLITRRLLGLETVLSLGLCAPEHDDETSWNFDLDPGGVDPVLGISALKDAYFKREPGYDRGITVPALVDVNSGAVVTNDFQFIPYHLATQWKQWHRPGAPDLYPEDRAQEHRKLTKQIFDDVNNGVYRAGFATSQSAYEDAYRAVFNRLDALDERLSSQRFLLGEAFTAADIYLFATLVRFDAVYHGHFKCNRNKLTEMPVLWAYARDLFQTPGFGDTVDFEQIKRHYYCVHTNVNPTQIIPAGPDLSGWLAPHGREELSGHPFGDGTPTPAPVTGEEVPTPVA